MFIGLFYSIFITVTNMRLRKNCSENETILLFELKNVMFEIQNKPFDIPKEPPLWIYGDKFSVLCQPYKNNVCFISIRLITAEFYLHCNKELYSIFMVLSFFIFGYIIMHLYRKFVYNTVFIVYLNFCTSFFYQFYYNLHFLL